MHETMKRLYTAAMEIKGITSQSELAKRLCVSPQKVSNWETRGISSQGILEAAACIGCSANWLWKGKGSMLLTTNGPEQQLARDELTLIDGFRAAHVEVKNVMMTLAKEVLSRPRTQDSPRRTG